MIYKDIGASIALAMTMRRRLCSIAIPFLMIVAPAVAKA
jgi:hypothetical protein